MTVWWPDTALEYAGFVVYAVLAGLFVYWLSGVDTNAFISRLFREPPNPTAQTYVECDDPPRCRRAMCETCADGHAAYVADGGDPARWPLLMEETRARWRREARQASSPNRSVAPREVDECGARRSRGSRQHGAVDVGDRVAAPVVAAVDAGEDAADRDARGAERGVV
jgi:hypothetical protein